MNNAASPQTGMASITRKPLRALSLRANFSWTLAGAGVFTVCQYGIIAVLAKSGSPELVGRFTFSVAVVSPILAATMLHLRQVQVTDARDEYLFQDYFGTRIVTSALAMLIIIGLILLSPDTPEAKWAIFWVGVAKSIDSVDEIIRGLFQRYERMNLSGTAQMIRGPAGLCALATVFLLTKDVARSAAAMAMTWMLVLVFYSLPQAYLLRRRQPAGLGQQFRVRPCFDPRVVCRLVWRALPAGAGMFVYALMVNIPRYALKRYWGEAEIGFYSAIAYANVAVLMVVSALGQASSPRLGAYFAEDLEQFRRLMRKLVWIAVLMGGAYVAGVVVLGKPVLTVLYRPEYANYHTEFIILALVGFGIFLLFFAGVGVSATRNFIVILVAHSAACLTVVVVSYVLVPTYGVRGAALATLSANVVSVVVLFGGMHVLLARRERELARPMAGAESEPM